MGETKEATFRSNETLFARVRFFSYIATMKKLSDLFEKGSNTLIVTDEVNIKNLFKDVDKEVEPMKGNYGTFENENVEGSRGVYINGKTFHFMTEDSFDKLLNELECIIC